DPLNEIPKDQPTLIPQKRASMVSLDTIRKDPRWRDPNLREVISMLSHPMDPVKSNAAAYLQHLCYENDTVKQDIRQLRGIPVLVGLLDHPKAEVHRKACGALRNISFGRDNFNKVAIKNSDGIPALLRLLRRSDDVEVRELVTGTLWNISSHEPLKMIVINHGLQTLTDEIIIPHSGLRGDPNDPARPGDPEWNTVFKNTSGCLRNVSSDGAEARQRLRECDGLVDALLHALYSASVENCVCILRNLSYHVHKEVPGAEKFHIQAANHSAKSGGQHKKKDEPDCFGGRTTKGKRHGAGEKKSGGVDLSKRSLPMKGLELLYQPEVVRLYLSLLKLSQNHNTLEAAAGALQNLSAGHWAVSHTRDTKPVKCKVYVFEFCSFGLIRIFSVLLICECVSQSVRETKAASHLLQTVWTYKDLRHTLYKAGWNKTHFKVTAVKAP
uniref:ARVCF delta catenin family member n=1 Tax=Sinocyclocheilus grahami TaxID=75366 RepID=A0A672LGC9_SINGR